MPHGKTLKELLETEDVIFAPGAWDALSALLIEQAGFPALCSSGFAISAGLGLPDAELYTATENAETVRRMAAVTDIPIIADIDTGYGNAVNVMRTIRQFIDAGASAVFMEDQEAPKRCPICVSDPPRLVSKEEGVGKIRAAVDARADRDLIIIGRTDAQGDDAVERACAYADAGADMIMTVTRSFNSVAEVKACQEAHGKPMMLSLTPTTWVEREFTRENLIDCGVKIGVFPIQVLYAAVTSMRQRLDQLRESEYAPTVTGDDIHHKDFIKLIGFDKVEALQEEYLPAAVPAEVG
jgi:methylisocitrate lyase